MAGATQLLTETSEEKTPGQKSTTKLPPSPSVQATKRETREIQESTTSSAEETFQRIFHISAEELKSIQGFETLSERKKLFVLRNLEQLARGRIQTEAATVAYGA